MSALPWITCVCVSRNRPTFLKRAIRYFQFQTYPRKDLVIVHEGNTEVWNDPSLDLENITIVEITAGATLTLGERRNLSIQHAKGDYFCQWDDDDWFHNKRLEIQMDRLGSSGKPAGVLSRLILYDCLSQQAYLSSERLWEGTLLCKTDIVTNFIQYPKLNIGEDDSLVVDLIKRDYVQSVAAPFVYAYIYHGGNTWDATHFQQLFQAGYMLDETSVTLMKKIFDTSVSYEEMSARVKGLNLEVSDLIRKTPGQFPEKNIHTS